METKNRNANSDVKAAMRDFLGAFESFKASNDARLAAIEKKKDDILLSDKVERISKALTDQKSALDRMALASQRPAVGAGRDDSEKKQAILTYMRKGDAGALNAIEQKSLNASNDAQGGYLAPEPTERLIAAAVRDISPIRQIASVREIGVTTFKKPVSLGGGAAGWVGETGGRVETATPTLSSIDFPTMELYAMPAASQTLLDDAIVDIEQWLADEVQGEFAAQETAAFVNGDGVNRPRGFLAYTKTAEAVRTQSEIGYIATGADGAFAASNPGDTLLDLIYAPKQAFRANGRFVMNRKTLSAVRKFKDADGNYLWQPAVAAGAPSTLFGYPVIEAEDMPDIAANSYSVAFGDFARGYLIVDRQGVRILRDPYSAKPYVLFYTTKRVGGGVQNFDAIKLLKFAAS
ncbi:MAG: phage major capsid protein [Parvularculaceae bacterium]|nr:phage major capsid protein [Parvularculaceae bacterium]